MTRTERATYPRAIIKDRSEAKNAMDKRTPKGGAGSHNWGDLQREREYEEAGTMDEEAEFEEAGASSPERRASSLTEEEIQQAREFRKKALKSEGVDLAAIARTSAAVSVSPPNAEVPIISDANTAALTAA